MNVYINSAEQISAQEPLSNSWITDCKNYKGTNPVEIIDPDYKQYFSSQEIRRNCKLLRRAMLVATKAVENSLLPNVDGVITGTGLGAVTNTELFLKDLVYNGEECLKPSYFMQSTHNTVSSVIGITLKCNGYNSTYCHKGISFESALLDGFIKIKANELNSIFLGGFDEVTPDYFTILEKSGYLGGSSTGFACGSAVGFVVSNIKNSNTFCEIISASMCYGSDAEILNQTFDYVLQQAKITKDEITAVMTSINGNTENDEIYVKNLKAVGLEKPMLQYADIFGECYTASAYGMYIAVQAFKNKEFAKISQIDRNISLNSPKFILLYRHFKNKNHSFIVLKKC